jgi:hypothetical protein
MEITGEEVKPTARTLGFMCLWAWANYFVPV